MNFGQIKQAALNALAEQGTTPLVWTDPILSRGINEGQSMFALLAGRPQGSTSLTLTPGRTMVPFPAGILQVLELRIAGALLSRGDIQALGAVHPSWMSDGPGTPRQWFPIGRFRCGLYPRPNAAYTLVVGGILQPANLVNATDVPGLPVEDHEALVRYAIYYGLLMGGEADLDRALGVYGVPDAKGAIPPGSFLHYVSKAMTDQGMLQAVLGAEIRR